MPTQQTKVYKIGICCDSPTHAALRRKSKDWLAQNQDDVPCTADFFLCELFLYTNLFAGDGMPFSN
jgi:hypothetical protein